MELFESKNIFGEPLIPCSSDPLTGFYRNSCCDTGPDDHSVHSVCVVLTEEFLLFSKNQGNDLSTPMPQYGFKGLKPGDKWCLCATRWKEALDAGKAPQVVLEASHEYSLEFIDINDLIAHAFKN